MIALGEAAALHDTVRLFGAVVRKADGAAERAMRLVSIWARAGQEHGL